MKIRDKLKEDINSEVTPNRKVFKLNINEQIMENNKPILYAEDEETLKELVKEGLGAFGYNNVHTYEDGLLAHNAIESGEINPSLILTDYDYKIPEMNGLGFLKIYASKIPCIMMTGNKKEVEQKALDLGAKVVLEKPFKLKELSDAVDKYIK